MTTKTSRLFELDGLRGLAAAAVFCGHVMMLLPMVPYAQILWRTPVSPLLGSHSPVYMFFVLSGFVLSKPFMTGAGPRYGDFICRRVFRIYPAYWFALAVSLICILAFRQNGMAGLSAWAQSMYHKSPAAIDLSQLWRHLALIPTFDDKLIDPPVWSLVVEMRASLIVPVLIFGFKRSPSLWVDLIVVAALIFVGRFSFLLTFLPMFAMGIVLAKYWSITSSWCRRLTPLMGVVFTTAAIVLFTSDNALISVVHGKSIYFSALGAMGLIALASSRERFRALLNSRGVQFLGHISYSLYLLHFPILFATMSLLKTSIGFTASAIVSAIVAVALSAAVYWGIEKPLIRVGHRCAKVLFGSHTSSTPAVSTTMPQDVAEESR